MIINFVLFGATHIQTLLVIFIISIIIPLITYVANNENINKNISLILAIIMISHELIKPFYRIYLYGHDPSVVLPIHVCHLASISLGIFLLTRINVFFEIGYFWGLTGNFLAMVTPDLEYSYPDMEYITYYFGHGLLFLSIIFTSICISTKLKWISILRISIISLLLLPIIYLVNIFLGKNNLDVNYWYLMKMPEGETLLSLFPSPPMHIPYLIIFAVLLFIISFLPYYIFKKLGKRRYSSHYKF